MTWHLNHIHTVMEEMRSGEAGLSAQEAGRRLRKHGFNELLEQSGRTPLRILWEQFTATMVLILLGAAVTAAFLGDAKNAIAIIAILHTEPRSSQSSCHGRGRSGCIFSH